MELTFAEEIAWKDHVHQLHLAARNYELLAAAEDERYRAYLKEKYKPQKQEFT